MFQKIVIILALNMWFYARTIRYRYVSDDLAESRKKPPEFKSKWYRWWMQFSGQVKINPKVDHLITLTVHALICVFMYLGFGANNISFIAALLFTFNPANNQASVWTGGRGYALPALALVMSMTLPYLSPFLLFGGCWWTAGFPTPLVFIGSPHWWIVLFAPIIWFLHIKKFKKAVLVKFTTESFGEDSVIHPRKLILAIKTYGYYMLFCIIPFKLSFYHAFLQSCAGNEIMKKRAYSLCKFFWTGIIGIALSFWFFFNGYSLAAYGMWWFAITIAPYCNFKRINQEIAERFAYIPNIGLTVTVASLIAAHPYLIIGFLVLYATRMWYYMPTYTDDYWIVEYSVAESPDAWYAWHMRAIKRWDQQSFREALNMWVMAKMISPKEFKLLINISSVLFMLRKNAEASEFLDLAEKYIIAGQEKESKTIIEDLKRGKFDILI